MIRLCSRRIEGAKIAAILITGSLALTPGETPALAQAVEGRALAYVSIPLDGSSRGPACGLRLDGYRTGLGDRRADEPPPVVEVRFGLGEQPSDWRLVGIAPTELADSLNLDGSSALWIGAGLGIAAAVAIVVATDTICIGINASCSNDKDDNEDNDEDTNEPTRN
jgi:hypothetical protein